MFMQSSGASQIGVHDEREKKKEEREKTHTLCLPAVTQTTNTETESWVQMCIILLLLSPKSPHYMLHSLIFALFFPSAVPDDAVLNTVIWIRLTDIGKTRDTKLISLSTFSFLMHSATTVREEERHSV